MQVGRFSRPFFDYTAAAVRLDLGLTSPQAQWLADGGGPAAGGSIASLGARSAADDWLDSGGGDLPAAGPLLKHRCAPAGWHDSLREVVDGAAELSAQVTLSGSQTEGHYYKRMEMGAVTRDAVSVDKIELQLPGPLLATCTE